jgi:peptidyl-prolyl cis-trans isomerase SurA
MIKKIYYSLLISFFFHNTLALSNTDVFIFATVNNKIITNFDIEKEIEYLKILNPSISQLEKKRVSKLAENSLINEFVKKSELEKTFDLNADGKFKDNPFSEEYFVNLYTKLNFSSEENFRRELNKVNNYSLDEIKEKLKIEILWNELIYMRFGNQIKIDKDSMLKKIESFKNKNLNEYQISEIVFKKKKNEKIEILRNKIKRSIKEIGFNNTANIYSISESSKMGGNIGWIKETNLSGEILKNLKKLNEGQNTDIIQVGNNFLILKIEKIKIKEILINKDEELKKMVKFETNKQLNQYSKIFFDKTKINYNISEK